jgi:hypothetical protein
VPVHHPLGADRFQASPPGITRMSNSGRVRSRGRLVPQANTGTFGWAQTVTELI